MEDQMELGEDVFKEIGIEVGKISDRMDIWRDWRLSWGTDIGSEIGIDMKKRICERCIGKIQGGWVLRYELGDSYRYNLTLIGERNCILQINGDRLIDWTG